MTTTLDGKLATTKNAALVPPWGIAPPDDVPAVAAWGARAIYQGTEFEFVVDRMGAVGDDDASATLLDWLNLFGLDLLRGKLRRERLPNNSAATITILSGAFTIVASPRRSYGYLYIGAWAVEP